MLKFNSIDRARKSKLFVIKNSEKIGDNAASTSLINTSLLRTPNGQFFLASELGEPENLVPTEDAPLYDGSFMIRPVTKSDAYKWAKKECPEALSRLEELGITKANQELVLLADFRCGTYDEADYIHHVIYKQVDGDGYVVATSDSTASMYPESMIVSVGSPDGAVSFVEELYVHNLLEAQMKEWAGSHLPVNEYVKLFGPVETA